MPANMKRNRLKYLLTGLAAFTCLLYISGCRKEDAIAQDAKEKGPYVSRADGARFFSGYQRAVIAWKNTDPNISVAKLYWNNGNDSLITAVNGSADSVKIEVDNLAEGEHTFALFTYDKNNISSGKVLVSGHVYGEQYAATMDNRQLENLTYTDGGVLKTEWQPFSGNGIGGTQVFYTGADGVERMQSVAATDAVLLLENLPGVIRGTIKYRTAYLPGPLVIDTLYSPFKTAAYLNRQAYFDSLPGWKLRCKVMVEAQTVRDHGGIMAFKEKMDTAIAKSSRRFQVPGINDAGGNQLHFYMIDVEQFTGASTQYTTKQWLNDNTLDFMLVVNGNAASGDDSWGWRRAPYLTLGHDYAGLFGDNAVDALLHEFGHVRGMYDLYLGEVTAAKNPVSGMGYESVRCIMNYPYGGETVWSEFSKIIINASAGSKVAKPYWDFFPTAFSVNVKRKDHTAAAGARLRFYPVIQTSTGNEVRANDVVQYRATLDASGGYVFYPPNPFAVNQVASNNIYNFLVEVIYTAGATEYKEYTWMPMNDALVAGSKGLPYELKIKLAR